MKLPSPKEARRRTVIATRHEKSRRRAGLFAPAQIFRCRPGGRVQWRRIPPLRQAIPGEHHARMQPRRLLRLALVMTASIMVVPLAAVSCGGSGGHASSTSSGGSGGSGGHDGGTTTSTGGTGGDGGLSLLDHASGCTNGEPCGDGGVCAGNVCCAAELACGKTCCAGGSVCSFQACVVPGASCHDSTD